MAKVLFLAENADLFFWKQFWAERKAKRGNEQWKFRAGGVPVVSNDAKHRSFSWRKRREKKWTIFFGDRVEISGVAQSFACLAKEKIVKKTGHPKKNEDYIVY